jgi:hypothetical protein
MKRINLYLALLMGLLPLREYRGGGMKTTKKTPRNTIAETASFILIRPLEAVTLNKLLARAHTCNWF